MDKILRRDYPDSTSSKVQTAPIVKNQTWTLQNALISGYNSKNPY